MTICQTYFSSFSQQEYHYLTAEGGVDSDPDTQQPPPNYTAHK